MVRRPLAMLISTVAGKPCLSEPWVSAAEQYLRWIFRILKIFQQVTSYGSLPTQIWGGEWTHPRWFGCLLATGLRCLVTVITQIPVSLGYSWSTSTMAV